MKLAAGLIVGSENRTMAGSADGPQGARAVIGHTRQKSAQAPTLGPEKVGKPAQVCSADVARSWTESTGQEKRKLFFARCWYRVMQPRSAPRSAIVLSPDADPPSLNKIQAMSGTGCASDTFRAHSIPDLILTSGHLANLLTVDTVEVSSLSWDHGCST